MVKKPTVKTVTLEVETTLSVAKLRGKKFWAAVIEPCAGIKVRQASAHSLRR